MFIIMCNNVLQENNTQNKQTLSECSAENKTNPKVSSEETSKQNGHDTRDEKQMRKKRKRQTEENHQNTEEKIKKKHKKRNQEEFDGKNILRISYCLSLESNRTLISFLSFLTNQRV